MKNKFIAALNSLPYVSICNGKIFTEAKEYKPESLPILKECQKEIPELVIYESRGKFRLIREI